MKTSWTGSIYTSAAVFILAAAVGCANRATPNSQSNGDELVEKGDSPTPKGKEGGVAADESLDLKGYSDLGVPAIDKPWSGVELAAAAKVLIALAQKSPQQLPRYKSTRS